MPSCTHDYIRIHSYADAERLFNETPAIRGTDKDCYGVPLQRNRKAHAYKALHKHIDTVRGETTYHSVLYGTTVVEYFPDGTIRVNLSYRSQSTCGFAYALTPLSINAYLRNGDTILSCAAGQFIANGAITLAPTPDGGYAPTSAPQRYVDKLNRSRAAQVRKTIRPLLDYMHTLAALCPLEREAVREMHRYRETLALFDPDMANPDHFPAFAALMMCYGTAGYTLRPDYKDRLLKRAYETSLCYDPEPVPYGQVKPNSYIVSKF